MRDPAPICRPRLTRRGLGAVCALGLAPLAWACGSDSERRHGAALDAGLDSSSLGGSGGAASGVVDGGPGGRVEVHDSGGGNTASDGASLRDAEPTPDGGMRGRYLWQRFYDRSFAAHVEVDTSDAAIVSGTMFDAKDITLGATTLTSHGAADVMLSRVLPDGNVDWARNYGAAGEDYPVSFVLDGSDRIRITGLYNGTGNIGGPSFPPFAGSPGRYDVYVAGLTASGDHEWSRTVNTTVEGFGGPGLAVDGSGNVFVPISFAGTATIASVNHASTGSWDTALVRYAAPSGASSGIVLPLGGPGDDRMTAALFTGAEVLAIGTFHDAVTFPTAPPTTLTSAGGSDVFIARVSTAGNVTSVLQLGGTGDEQVATAKLASSGNVVLAGTFSSPSLSILGGQPLVNAGGGDAFVAALSPVLTHLWSVRFGGDADDHARDLALGPLDAVVVTGEFRNTITLGDRSHDAVRGADAGPTEIDAFVVKLDAAGVPLWSRTAGGAAPDRGLGVAVDRQGAVYLVASFQSPIDFGGGESLTPDPGQWASALVKYSP